MSGGYFGLDASYLHIFWALSPIFICYEIPLQLVILTGILKSFIENEIREALYRPPFYPRVSCAITCYSEGELARKTIESLTNQYYPGFIEMIAVVDGARVNTTTFDCLNSMVTQVNAIPNRRLVVVPKWQRGGRVSTLNAGRRFASGSIIFAADADTMFTLDTVANAVKHFLDPSVVAVGGNLRVMNAGDTLLTRLQSLEYMLTISYAKMGLGQWNILNNVSGAMGFFRRETLDAIGGWNNGTAEDLDITFRQLQYFGRHPNLKIIFAHDAIGYTEVPSTLVGFARQRMRWDGDCYYIVIKKHWRAFNPRVLGLRSFIGMLYTGLLGQIVVPITVFANLVAVLLTRHENVADLMMPMYILYFTLTSAMFALYLLLVSRFHKKDIPLVLLLPLYPIFGLLKLFISVAGLARSAIFESYKDSSMAPYWVLRRVK